MIKTVFLALIASFIFVMPGHAYAKKVYGVFRVVKGDVKIKTKRSKKYKKAKLGQKVFPRDVVKTGKDSRAKIVMIDENVINVSPDSKIKIQKYEFKPKKNAKNVLLKVFYGKIRSKVNQKYDGKKNKFQIKTASAVAGVRGTDFLASYDKATKTSNVVTFEGKVVFGLPGKNGAILKPVEVKPGQISNVVNRAVPTAPKELPKTALAKFDISSDADKFEKKENRNNNAKREGKGKDKKGDKNKRRLPSNQGPNEPTEPNEPPPPKSFDPDVEHCSDCDIAPPPVFQAPPPPPPEFKPPEICESCREFIGDKTRLHIDVK